MYIGIQCVSNDAFIFLVDDFTVDVPVDIPRYSEVVSLPGTIERVKGIPAPVKEQPKNADRSLLGYKAIVMAH